MHRSRLLMWIPLVLLVVFSICVVIFFLHFSAFRTEGIHILGEYAHIKLQEKCYFIEGGEDGPQVTGESTLTISAMVYPPKENGGLSSVTGHINVEKYPISLEHGYNANTAGVKKNYILISGQSTVHLNPNWERYYLVWITRSDPRIIFVEILDSDGQTVVAVCADSPDEAIKNYTRFSYEMSDFLE